MTRGDAGPGPARSPNEIWPTAGLSPVARAGVLAAGLPGAAVHEATIDRPVDEVWGFISDLESSVPTFDGAVRALRITSRDGTRLTAESRSGIGPLSFRLGFDIDLEDGWCWMVSRPRAYVVAMAATAEPGDPGSTRYVQVEGLARRGRLFAPILRATRWASARHIAGDVAGLAKALDARAVRQDHRRAT